MSMPRMNGDKLMERVRQMISSSSQNGWESFRSLSPSTIRERPDFYVYKDTMFVLSSGGDETKE